MTFAALWSSRVELTPGASFLVFQEDGGSTHAWTYGEFDQVVARTAAGLAAHGVEAGTAVHMALRNSPIFVATWLACARLGAWMVPVDPASTARDLRQQIDRVKPVLGICATDRREVYAAAAGDLPFVEVSETGSGVTTDIFGVEESDELGGSGAQPLPGDRLAVMFTSGTTSQPKGVVLTQANYVTLARSMSGIIDLRPDHRFLVTLPMFHANAQYYCFCPAIAVGASVALTASFSASRWVQSAHDLEVTHASLFAAPVRMILARVPDDAPALHLVHVWYAQSLGEEHHARFGELVGALPRQLYGMTETVAIVTADTSTPPRHDAIGRPIPGRRLRLLDQTTGLPARSGEPGMISVAGTRGMDLFVEYLDDPAVTERSFSEIDGVTWFATGDLAAEGPDGLMRFIGRADDVIKVAGENVSLSEVEATIAQAPGVLEAAVVARPDEMRDHVPVAYVVAREDGPAPTIGDLEAWARVELSPAARPREWILIDSLPRTSVGKVKRLALTDAASSHGTTTAP
ncbi:MAG: AMP-binding protein [Flavobacterium sp.]|nr:AMP-binding protein [Aeromicrobium sp.]